jgi:hypothetical protein
MPKEKTISLVETDSLNLALGTMMAIRHNYNADKKLLNDQIHFLKKEECFL